MQQLHSDTLRFLNALKKNNNKPWFEKNKTQYETIRQSTIDFMAALITEVSRFDDAAVNAIARKSVMRIYRDTRFSKDKSPYKINIGAGISGSPKFGPASAGYYLHLQPGNSFIGGGIWMPEPALLHKIRQEIDYNFAGFKKIVEAKNFKKMFGKPDESEKLTRPPKDYDAENAAIEYLKLKSFTCSTPFDDKEVLSENFLMSAVAVCKQLYPFLRFLNQALG